MQPFMHELAVKRWKRYGHDRLYVSTPDAERVGWLDLNTGAMHLDMPALAGEFDAALLEHFGVSSEAHPAPSLATPVQTPPPMSPVPLVYAVDVADAGSDLARNKPGQQAREQAVALQAEAPVRTALARVLGIKTEERAWRLGASGEEKVAAQLEKLARRDDRWRFLHAVQVGKRGSDIDHLVIGPGGVYTLNTKNHPGQSLWVGGDTFLVDGHRQPYVRNSRFEAERASRLLSAVVGLPVPVQGVVVPVGADELTIKSQPRDVHVVNRRRLGQWLSERLEVLAAPQIDILFAAARRSTTWTS
jgi:hypothetical protein